jgi:hypothetical protein
MEDTRTEYPRWEAVSTAARRIPLAGLAGFGVVAAVRALTLPRTLWELDEILFARAIEKFEPLAHRPHPPGYPLLVGLGKLFDRVCHDPFASLVALSFVSSLVGYAALVAAFRRLAGRAEGERVAVAGALLFQLSPVMLVQGPLPMSDPPALMFIALALWAAVSLAEDGSALSALALGACASAAIGCRPQLALAVLPMLAMALWQAPGWRRRGEALAAFTLVSLLWFVPLVAATGGLAGFLDYQARQASYVAAHDAGLARQSASFGRVFATFVGHPWGTRWLSLPVLLAALAGVARLLRQGRKTALPLAVLSAAHLAFCLLVMDPADGVRYALPAVLGVAFAAAEGFEAAGSLWRRPALTWVLTALVLAASAAYAWPVLRVRSTTASPAAQAVAWIRQHLTRKAMLLIEPEMEAHAAHLLRDYDIAPIGKGLYRAARRPRAPLYLVSEGESGWPGAVTFRWPDTDAYRRLTRNHYRVVSLSPIPTGQRFQIVRGIYGWEPTAREARWRWMGPDAALQVFPRGAARAVAVKLALCPRSALPSNTVAMSVNGGPAVTVEVARGTKRMVELPVPRSGPVEITFRSAHSVVPSGRADGRRLAVQLLAVEQIARQAGASL